MNQVNKGLLFEKERVLNLLRDNSRRKTLVKCHIGEQASIWNDIDAVLQTLCELYISICALDKILKKVIENNQTEEYNGKENYVVSEQEGMIMQSLLIPAILDLKLQTEAYGLSLAIN